MSATNEQVAAQAVEAMRTAYMTAARRLNVSEATAGQWWLGYTSGTPPRADGGVDAQNAGALRQLGTALSAWATTHKAWALAGKRTDGTAYSFARWVDEANTHAASISFIAQVAADTRAWAGLKYVATETAKDIATGAAKVADAALDIGKALPWVLGALAVITVGVLAVIYLPHPKG